jgi:hypothetical protein
MSPLLCRYEIQHYPVKYCCNGLIGMARHSVRVLLTKQICKELCHLGCLRRVHRHVLTGTDCVMLSPLYLIRISPRSTLVDVGPCGTTTEATGIPVSFRNCFRIAFSISADNTNPRYSSKDLSIHCALTMPRETGNAGDAVMLQLTECSSPVGLWLASTTRGSYEAPQ